MDICNLSRNLIYFIAISDNIVKNLHINLIYHKKEFFYIH